MTQISKNKVLCNTGASDYEEIESSTLNKHMCVFLYIHIYSICTYSAGYNNFIIYVNCDWCTCGA